MSFEKLSSVIDQAMSKTDLRDRLRAHQRVARPIEAGKAQSARIAAIKAKFGGEYEDVPDRIEKYEEKMLLNEHIIRPGIIACQTEPRGTTYCSGYWHIGRRFSNIYGEYIWHAYERCPVYRKEIELDNANMKTTQEHHRSKRERWE